VAEALDLGAAIILGGGEVQSGGRRKSAILGDVCEALIGAIYLDGGLEPAGRFIRDNWVRLVETREGPFRDAKSALQEWAQGEGLGTPAYEVVARSGPDHEPRFVVDATIETIEPGRGEGGTIRQAERAAARQVLVRQGVWDARE
jgi:ribonuclease-3